MEESSNKVDQPLDRDKLMKLNKEDIIEYFFNTNKLSLALSELSETVRQVSSRLEKNESELVIAKNSNVKLIEQIDRLESRIINNERLSAKNAQYLRRWQIEVKNISEQQNGDELKTNMANLLSLTGQTVSPNDLDKCHTLKNKGVIMEFKEREIRDAVLRGRKKLKNKSTDLKI